MFHSFTGNTKGQQMDYILLNESCATVESSILRPRVGSNFASDHDPVVVTCVPHNITNQVKTVR